MFPFAEPKTSNADPTRDTSGGTVLVPALSRLGFPVLVFGATFLALAGMLIFLFSPDRFPVRMGHRVVRLKDIRSEEAALLQEREQLLRERATLKSEETAPVLTLAQERAREFPPLGRALLALEEVRASFVSATDPIALPTIEFHNEDRTVRIGGDVTDAGGRSVQILAAFVDALRSVPVFERVSEPEYAPVELPGGGNTVPFAVTLTLKQ